MRRREHGLLERVRSRAPLDDVTGVRARRGHEPLEPLGLGAAVVIHERDELGAGRAPADVAPEGGAAAAHDGPHIPLGGQRMTVDHPLGRGGVVVVHDHEFPGLVERLLFERV